VEQRDTTKRTASKSVQQTREVQNEEKHTHGLNFVFGQPTSLFNNNEKESNQEVNDHNTHIKSYPDEKRLVFLM
jgi:hypothetical protein